MSKGENKPSSDVICSIPWKHVATKPSGEYRLCCLAKQPESTYCNNEGKALNVIQDPLAESRNSPIAKEVRKKMLEGEWHPVCKKCFEEEDAGLRSRRIFYREMESDKNFPITAQAKTASDGSIRHEDFPLETFDIRVGNLCNLKCRMCGPIYSTKWYADYQNLTNDDHFFSGSEKIHFNNKEELNRFQWHESDFFWNEVLSIGSGIQHVYLIGGEPLIIKRQIEFLRMLVAKGYSKNIEIEYNSNLTVLPEEIIALWKKFKKVTLGISIESIFAENDYIRHPSRFQDVVTNIKKLDAHVSKNFRIWLTTTFQVLNVLSLPKLIDWVESSNFEFINQFPNSPLIHIHPAHTPLYYNVRCLPKQAKVLAQHKLHKKIFDLEEKYQITGMKKYDKTAKKLASVITFMNQQDDAESIKEFIKVTNKLDTIRNESFSKTFVELSNAIEFNGGNLSDSLNI